MMIKRKNELAGALISQPCTTTIPMYDLTIIITFKEYDIKCKNVPKFNSTALYNNIIVY